jgi:hypothetical protein
MTSQTVQFRATQSRGDYTAVRGWVVRETLLAVAALGFLTCSCLMLKRPDLFGRGRLAPGFIKTVVAVSAVLAWRTLIWRPLMGTFARRVVYPIDGYQVLYPTWWPAVQPAAGWEQHPVTHIRDLTGLEIHTRLLPGREERQHSGHLILFCAGNGGVAEEATPNEFTALRESGYSLLLYHPPQYGETGGRRTPQSDMLAAEACLQYLITERGAGGAGFAEGNIHLVGWSMGSGAAIELMNRYEVGRSLLVVPFARIRTVMTRWIGSGFLSHFMHWAARGTVADWVEYNNADKMGTLRPRSVTIIQVRNDGMMGRESPREGEVLRDIWCRSRGLDPTMSLSAEGSQLFSQDGATLLFESRGDLGHIVETDRVVRAMEQVFISIQGQQDS